MRAQTFKRAALTEAAERLAFPLGCVSGAPAANLGSRSQPSCSFGIATSIVPAPVAKIPAPVAVAGVGALSRQHALRCTAQRVGFALRRCTGPRTRTGQYPWWVAVIGTISCVRLLAVC
jgi:hypothetical protein